MGCIGSGEPCAVCVGHHATRVYQYTTRTPGTERRIAKGIAQSRIGGTQSVIGAAVTREHHHILVAHLSDGRGLEEVEVAGILFLIKCGILCAGRVSYLAVTRAGWDEIVVNLGARTKGVHGLRVQFKSRGVLESVVDVCTETTFVIRVFLVCYIFYKDRGVEIYDGTLHTTTAVLGKVDGGERSVGAVALAHHGHTAPSARMGIEIVCLLSGLAVFHFHQVGGKHGVPLPVHKMREDGAFVFPPAEVFHWSGPHSDVRPAIGGISHIVRANDISTVLAGVIWVFKHSGFTVGKMFPQRKVGVLCRGKHGAAGHPH